MAWTMKQLLEWHHISRQGAHQAIAQFHKYQRDVLTTMELAGEARQEHPQIGCRDIHYAKRKQMPRGRDWTDQALLAGGYRIKKPGSSFTQAGLNICSNLIEGLEITGPNQVWQTDITFIWVNRRWYFLSFVIDVFTRQIVAAHCSRNMSAASQIRCLAKALARQKDADLSQLIIHTDRGSQYTSKEFKQYLKRWNLGQSMAHYAWQNAYCERVNRTIKRNYLDHYEIPTFAALCASVHKAVRCYNASKPHRGLPSRMAPDQFIQELNQGFHPDYRVKIWSPLTATKMLHLN